MNKIKLLILMAVIACFVAPVYAISFSVDVSPSKDLTNGDVANVEASASGNDLRSLWIERWSEERNEWIADKANFDCSGTSCSVEYSYLRKTEASIEIRAKAVDRTDGGTTTESSSRTRIEWSEEPSNQPPTVELEKPEDNEEISLPYTFRWDVDDPEGDIVENTIVIQEEGKNDPEIEKYVESDESYTVKEGRLEKGEEYDWWVVSENEHAAFTKADGEVRSFTVREKNDDDEDDDDDTTTAKCEIGVNDLKLDPSSVVKGEKSQASIKVENSGDKDQEVTVKIYTDDQTFFEDNTKIKDGKARTFKTNVTVNEDSLVYAKITTEGSPCGSKSFKRSSELLFLGEKVGKANLTVSVEDEDGDGIRAAEVEVTNGNFRLDYTDSNGEISFNNLEPGDYSVEVSKDDYEIEERSISLEDGSDRTMKFTLTREDDADDDEDREDAELTVHVEDGANFELEDAKVTVENGDDEVEYTDRNGDADFDLEADEYDILVECNGEKETDEVDLDEGEEETVYVDFDEEFDSDICETGDDDDFDNEDGLNIRFVEYPREVCRGSSFLADVTIGNNGGFHEVVTLTGSGLGSISIGKSFSLSEGEQVTKSLRFTNVQGSGTEKFKIIATNHESNKATREIEVENCIGSPAGDAASITMDLGSKQVNTGDTLEVKGYVDGVRGRTEVTVRSNGRQKARVSTEPDGYYQTFIRMDEPGEHVITASSGGASTSRRVNVIPRATVNYVEIPEKVFEGEEFEVCAGIGSKARPDVFLLKDGEVLESKNGNGRVCFQRTASGVGEHRYEVKAFTYDKESSASRKVEVLEAAPEVTNFPDEVATVESSSGMVKVELYNTHDEQRSYNLELVGLPSSWTSQSEKQVILNKGQRKTVYFYLTPQSEGSFNPWIDVEADGEIIHRQKVEVFSGGTTKPAKRSVFRRLVDLFSL